MKIESEHFVIEFNKNEEPCINEVLSLLEGRYIAITEKLGSELKQKVSVKICSDKYELDRALEMENAPEWIRGGISGGKTVIASPLNPPPGSDYHNVINTVVHEFVHVLLREINTAIPKWLDEGIASFEGKDNNEDWIRDTIRRGINHHTVPELDDLDTGEDYERFFELGGYPYSYSIIEFVVNVYGYNLLMELVRRPEKLEEIFQITKEEFYCRWIHYLEEHY